MVFEHQRRVPAQWKAIESISAKLQVNHETLRQWVRRAETDAGHRPGVTSDERAKIKELERENQGAAPGQRDPEGGGDFLRGGARPPVAEIVAFIDAHRDRFGVEPICRVLTEHGCQIAPNTYYAQEAPAVGLGRRARRVPQGRDPPGAPARTSRSTGRTRCGPSSTARTSASPAAPSSGSCGSSACQGARQGQVQGHDHPR